MAADLNFVKLNPPERERTYHFPGKGSFTIKDVVAVAIRPSGTHRLETADGKKWIVDFERQVVIELDMDAWTF